ncbi:hypothetical protein BZG02_13645 [Labilibaculum filiforme]|uniref:Uncharacterized protein n=1 Tax=Labilibaculum filiforme TaxID=1940526 RepID=A0A2N3HV98_9BACT|nr:hypothetical protein [Labilibaculum filiforme]PKQ61979.1 hypothetical protein BZG02_13645 [Labilibaculum filiforme]
MKLKSLLRTILKYLTVISSIGFMAWLISDFFGGMIIHLVMLWWLIIPIVILFGITLLISIILIIKEGIKNNKLISISHALSLLVILLFFLYNSELLKSNKVMDASLIDDLSRIDLIFRENGTFETNVSGMFGYSEKIRGKYILKNDSIIFLNKPYSNDFIPDTVLIDNDKNSIFFRKNKDGEFNREKSFVNYFEINFKEFK